MKVFPFIINILIQSTMYRLTINVEDLSIKEITLHLCPIPNQMEEKQVLIDHKNRPLLTKVGGGVSTTGTLSTTIILNIYHFNTTFLYLLNIFYKSFPFFPISAMFEQQLSVPLWSSRCMQTWRGKQMINASPGYHHKIRGE